MSVVKHLCVVSVSMYVISGNSVCSPVYGENDSEEQSRCISRVKDSFDTEIFRCTIIVFLKIGTSDLGIGTFK